MGFEVKKFADQASLVTAAAADTVALINQAIADNGCAQVVLTGGSNGIGLLAALKDAEIADWSKVHVYFGDERNVPVSDPESNEGQAREALLGQVEIPEENIHGMGLGDVDLARAAQKYEELIGQVKEFDLHLLGMGGEGHINSLFPHSEAVAETQRLVVAVKNSPKPPAERVSLTLPAIARAKKVWLLVSGAEKAEAAQQVIDRADPAEWPAAGAEGKESTVLYLAP